MSVLGVKEGAVPFARGITSREADPLQHHADLLRERCLLFVACTRAREVLSVTRAERRARSWPAVSEWHPVKACTAAVSGRSRTETATACAASAPRP